jgi:hypothetical protein
VLPHEKQHPRPNLRNKIYMSKRFWTKVVATSFRTLGVTMTPGSTPVTVLSSDSSGYVTSAKGATVPSDAEAGYAKGAKFVKTNGTVGATEYTNEGDETSCDFNALVTTSGDITAVVAGDGLTGGATSGSATLDVVAGTGLTAAADAIGLATGYTPSHIVKFAGTFTTAGGDAAESITVAGATATDIAIVTVKTAGVSPVSIVAAAAGTDAIAVTMSADPSTDHVLQYTVFRAVS